MRSISHALNSPSLRAAAIAAISRQVHLNNTACGNYTLSCSSFVFARKYRFLDR